MNLFLKDFLAFWIVCSTPDMVLVPFLVRISTLPLFYFNNILLCRSKTMWYVAAVYCHWAILAACHLIPRMIASCFTCFFVLSFFFCLCTLIYIFNVPQQHTIHVVVSCIFTIRVPVVYFCRSAAVSSVLFFCNLQQSELTDHMNVSSGEWGWDAQ